jgi:hypothetical protein
VIRFVMPWRATEPGDVTILTAPGRRLAKRITPTGIEDYDGALLFEPDARRLDGIDDLPDLLEELAARSDTCVIRALLKAEFAARPLVLRRIHDAPDRARPGHTIVAPFVAVPRSWAMIDIEPATCPPWIDPTDPVLVGGWLRRQLPEPFQMARCVAQLSGSAGIKPGLRAHLWFWLDRALDKPELDRWLKGAPGVDLQVFAAVQPHYCAQPTFAAGADDPCLDGRLSVLPGRDQVEVPDLPEPARAGSLASLASPLAALPRHGAAPPRAEAYALACLRSLALAPEGQRHRTCLAISCRLLALAKAGQLDPVTVAGRIKGVMRGRGFDGRSGRDLSEIDSILTWAWQTVEPEELPHAR